MPAFRLRFLFVARSRPILPGLPPIIRAFCGPIEIPMNGKFAKRMPYKHLHVGRDAELGARPHHPRQGVQIPCRNYSPFRVTPLGPWIRIEKKSPTDESVRDHIQQVPAVARMNSKVVGSFRSKPHQQRGHA